jgi:hypothetical protein
MLTENGIIALVPRKGRVELVDRVSPGERRARREQLAELVRELRSSFPELEPSDDVAGRFADYSFDIAEACSVPEPTVLAVADLARERGARVVRSSIQLHVCFDSDDKASGVVRLLALEHGIDPSAATQRVAFVGDSENDASCFAAFSNSFGVANLAGRPSLLPCYRARLARSAGFVEIADALLAARRSSRA